MKDTKLKQYLKSAVYLEKEIEAAREEIEELRELRQYTRSFVEVKGASDGNRAGRKPSQAEKAAEKLTAAEEKLTELIIRLTEAHESIRELISRVRNPSVRIIMERHYLLGESWEQVSENCFTCLRSVHIKNNEGLREIEPYFAEKPERLFQLVTGNQ